MLTLGRAHIRRGRSPLVAHLQFLAPHVRIPSVTHPSRILTLSLMQFLAARPLNMVLPHHTPYVTPHILHKHYAQSHDSDQYTNRVLSYVAVLHRR